ncbi:MAG TPA: hypothetical protein PLO51_01325 [Candidatus Micrarchaeota archaeon]|nr:hypothetical protein [Candidatus Micrarchaeota archaeon]
MRPSLMPHPAFPAFLALTFALALLPGCASLSGGTANQIAPAQNSSANWTDGAGLNAGGNSTAAMQGNAANSSNGSKPANTCETKFVKSCPDDTASYSVTCTDGYSKLVQCAPNPYGMDISGIPSNMQYFIGFDCYWRLRGKYPYGPVFDPFVVCQSQSAGWEEACTCAQGIQVYVTKWGFPNQ